MPNTPWTIHESGGESPETSYIRQLVNTNYEMRYDHCELRDETAELGKKHMWNENNK